MSQYILEADELPELHRLARDYYQDYLEIQRPLSAERMSEVVLKMGKAEEAFLETLRELDDICRAEHAGPITSLTIGNITIRERETYGPDLSTWEMLIEDRRASAWRD